MKQKELTLAEAYAVIKQRGLFRSVMAIAVDRALRDWKRYA